MAAGLNEVDGAKRSGMWEKYVALKAGQDFELMCISGGEPTRYSAVLEDFDTEGINDQPTVTLRRGELIIGDEAPAMQVNEDGLYHIVLDLNEAGDLANAQIIVAPVQWGVRGVSGDWGWKEMTRSEFSQESMTWTITFESVNTSEFKFAYGGGWKIQLDDAGKVKANTNLGVDYQPNGANIALQKGNNVTITLTWTLEGGAIANSYTHTQEGEWVVEDPTKFAVGLSGSCFGADASWSDPAGATLAVYDEAASNITNTTNFNGTYVYNLAGCAMSAGEFKVRVNGGWYGAGNSELTVSGIDVTGGDNFVLATAGTYDVKFTLVWEGGKAKSISAAFTQK